MKLSILICTMPERSELFKTLQNKILHQIEKAKTSEVEILSNDRLDITTGEKRNILLSEAKGEYLCFVDDDDDISDFYIEQLLNAINSNKDCASLKGVITWDGENPEIFEHSMKYKEYRSNIRYQEIAYERYPNHLNCIKSSIAKQISFTHKNHSEDTDFADALFKSGLIKSEHQIEEILYYYRYARKK